MNIMSVRPAARRPAVPSADASAAAPCRGEIAVEAGGQRKIRLLVFTTLYPNAAQPRHGLFVEERLQHLLASGRIGATVIAPVPWFPFRHPRFGRYAAFARVPRREERHGIQIEHPRYPVIPKFGMSVAPAMMYRAVIGALRNRRDCFDLIDAHYFYPDGVAAARLGTALSKPVVITARGSDLNIIARYRLPRRQIRHAAHCAAAIVAVSQALKVRAEALAVDAARVAVLRNGVDLDQFRPLGRERIRAGLGVTGPVWLAVGHLVELKGVDITLAALAEVPDATLLVAGTGPQKTYLRELGRRLGVAARVRFLGAVAHGRLCQYYNAADALLLASSREGMPNVVLEALACGTPVVVAPFASARELVTAPEAGEVARSRTAEAMAAAWRRLQARAVERATTRRLAERFGWAPVVEQQCALYTRVLAASRNASAHGVTR